MSLLQYFTLFVVIVLFIIFVQSWRRNRNAFISNWPIIGMQAAIVHNMSNILDYATLGLIHYGGTFHFKGPWYTNTNFIFTSDPMNVHHILSKNFGNYWKGSDVIEILNFFGDGILNSHFNEWKQKRELLHSLFTRKSFKMFSQQSIQKKLQNYLVPFLDHASNGRAQVDLQDIFERFTFDIASTTLFGFDPNFLTCDFTDEVSDISCIKAFCIIEEVILYRYVTPIWFWKLLNWFRISKEKKYIEAAEKINRFLHERITYLKREVQESHCCLMKMLMMEGGGEIEINDKFLRDTAANLFAAGNSTINVGLSWFFWLVSTHPDVEAKIVQEIKDNCLTKDENWVTASEEELDKLVYLHGAICESTRLYPPIPFEHRSAIKSDILPNGDHISPNTKILYSLYSMGRMEKIWGKDCMEFKPERWISERGGIIKVPSYKFITFNAGPRSCLGKDISFVQMKMVASAILCKFHIQMVEGHHVSPSVSTILGMKHGLKVKVTERGI